MFAAWQTFYQLTGAAAAQLIGLLFIVATLNRGQPQPGSEQGMRRFTSPTVVYLALVLVTSALALTPATDTGPACTVMALCALAGLVYAGWIGVQIGRQTEHTHWTDVWFYAAAPAAMTLLLVLATAATCLGMAHAACALGLVLLGLLLLAIRNAWDLITWLAPRRP